MTESNAADTIETLQRELAEARAANARVRAFVIKWQETETDYQDEDYDSTMALLTTMADDALSAVPPANSRVRQDVIEQCAKVADSLTFSSCGDPNYQHAAADDRASDIAKRIRALSAAVPPVQGA